MKTAKYQNNTKKSLKTSTPISENVANRFATSCKQLSIIKPNRQKKSCSNSDHDPLEVKKRRESKGLKPSCSFHRGPAEKVSIKENLQTPTGTAFPKCAFRRSKSSALKPLNTLWKYNNISDESPVYPDSWYGKSCRSSNQNSDFDYTNCHKDISNNKTVGQNSRNLRDSNSCLRLSLAGCNKPDSPFVSARNYHEVSTACTKKLRDANSYLRMSLAGCNNTDSPFVSTRNHHEVSSACTKKLNRLVNRESIFKDNFTALNKSTTFEKLKGRESETLSVLPHGEMPRLSNLSVGKKVRFSDKIELCGASTIIFNNLNSENTLLKGHRSEQAPHGIKGILASLEDNRVSVNEKDPRISTEKTQQMERSNIKDLKRIEESEKCAKRKFFKNGGLSNKDKMSQLKGIKLEKRWKDFEIEKDNVEDETGNILNSNNTSVKEDTTTSCPYYFEDLFEFLEDDSASLNEKKSRVSTAEIQQTKSPKINKITKIEETKSCPNKKVFNDRVEYKRDKTCQVKGIKLKNGNGNFQKEKIYQADDETGKILRSNITSDKENTIIPYPHYVRDIFEFPKDNSALLDEKKSSVSTTEIQQTKSTIINEIIGIGEVKTCQKKKISKDRGKYKRDKTCQSKGVKLKKDKGNFQKEKYQIDDETERILYSNITSVKEDTITPCPHYVNDLFEFIEDDSTLLNDKKSRVSTKEIQQTKNTTINEAIGIGETKTCLKKNIFKDGDGYKKDKWSQVKGVKLKNGKGNFQKEKDQVEEESIKFLHSKDASVKGDITKQYPNYIQELLEIIQDNKTLLDEKESRVSATDIQEITIASINGTRKIEEPKKYAKKKTFRGVGLSNIDQESQVQRLKLKNDNGNVGKEKDNVQDETRQSLHSKNASAKEDNDVQDPNCNEELSEFFGDNKALSNEKKSRIVTTEVKKIQRVTVNGIRIIEVSKECLNKKIFNKTIKFNRDKESKAQRVKLNDGRKNLGKEKGIAEDELRKDHHSKNKKRIQLSVDKTESSDWNTNVSSSQKLSIESKISSKYENKAINLELNDVAAYSTNEDVIFVNVLNNDKRNQKKGPICSQDFMNNKKYEKKIMLGSESHSSRSQTKGYFPIIGASDKKQPKSSNNSPNLIDKSQLQIAAMNINGKIAPAFKFGNVGDSVNKIESTNISVVENAFKSKHKKGESTARNLKSLEDTIIYPSTSTPFDSPLQETRAIFLNFQCLSPVLEHQSNYDTLYDFEQPFMFAEKTFSKSKQKCISKEEKLWSLITSTGSIDRSTGSFSATSIEKFKEQKETSQDILLFETPPLKMLSGKSIEGIIQHKEKNDDDFKKNRHFHKKLTHAASKRAEESENKAIRKRENNSELSIDQSQLSKHFEDVSSWNLCIEENEHKMKFFANKTE